ncbi:MAG: TolC family protein, partial [bacterium]|nr:TolC family protein [bacterium]
IAQRRKQSLELIKLGYEAGREHKGSLLTAQADLAEAEFEIAQATRNLEIAARMLCADLGYGKYSQIQVQGELAVSLLDPVTPDFEQLAGSVPLLQALIAQKDASRLSLKGATADMYPSVYASASPSKSGSNWPPDRSQWSAGVNVSVPIFSGGSQVAAVKRSESAYSQAQAEERNGRASVILTLAENWANLRDALGQLEVQQKFLIATEERSKIAEAQYKIGLMSFDNWIIIEDDLINAKKTLLNTQANAMIAEANWIQAKGVTLDEE